MKQLLILVICISFLACQKRGGDRDACISANSLSINSGESISISNCGSTFPEAYVEAELDWGDGTITSGQTGSHSYDTLGNYEIRLFINGEYAADVVDAEESKVKLNLVVQ